MGCCIGWMLFGFGLLGMWYGFTLANRQTLKPIQAEQNFRNLLPIMLLSITSLLFMGPGRWLAYYRPTFTWWFVMAHWIGLVLVVVFAVLSIGIKSFRKNPLTS